MYLKSNQIYDVKLCVFIYYFYIEIWNGFVIFYLLLSIFEAVCNKTPTVLLTADSVNTCSPLSRCSWEQTTSCSIQIRFWDKMVLSKPGTYNLLALSESHMKWSILNMVWSQNVSELFFSAFSLRLSFFLFIVYFNFVKKKAIQVFVLNISKCLKW